MLVNAKVTNVSLDPLKITATAKINGDFEAKLHFGRTTPGLRSAWNNHEDHLITPGDILRVSLNYYPKRRKGEEIEIIMITKLIPKDQITLHQ